MPDKKKVPPLFGAPILQVLLCDDDRSFLEQLQSRIHAILAHAHIPSQIRAYETVASIPVSIFENCDLAFLDIDFVGEKFSGIDIARMIRKSQHNAIIIFVTNYIEYAPEGYEVQAFRYILKNEVPQKLEHYINQAIIRHKSNRQTLQISVAGETITLFLSDILYIESQGHAAIIYTGCNSFRFYASIGRLEQELEPTGFLRLHKGFLVNMAHILQFKSQGAILSNGVKVPVSEKNYAEQKKKYLLWKGRQ